MNRSSSCLLGQLLPWLLVLCWNLSGFARAENLEKMIVNLIKGTSSLRNLAEELSNTCNQTYGLKAAETLMVEFDKTSACITQAKEDNPQHVVLILSSIIGPNPENENLTFNVLFNEIVPSIRNQCITPFIPALKGCTDLDGHRNIATLESLIDFFIEDGGRHFYDYIQDVTETRCVYEYQDFIIAECFDRLPDMLSQLQGNVSIFNQKNCRSLDEQSDCAIRIIQQGCSIATVNLLKEAKDVIMKGTDCSIKLGNHKDSDLGHNSILINCLLTQRIEKRHLQKKELVP